MIPLGIKRFSLSLIIVSLLAPFYVQSTLSASVSSWIWDSLLKLQFKMQPPLEENVGRNPILLIHVDEDTQQKMDVQWPWQRDIYSRILSRIKDYNPAVVGLNFVFLKESSQEQLDQAMIDTMKDIPETVLASYFRNDNMLKLPIHKFVSAVSPRVGIVNTIHDIDGTIRQQILFAVDNEKKVLLPSFSLQIALAYVGEDAIRKWLSKLPSWSFDDYKIIQNISDNELEKHNFQSYLRVGTNYTITEKNIEVVPAWKILLEDESFNLESLSNKIVLIGSHLILQKDIYKTPIGALSGVQVQAINALMLINENPPTLIPSRAFAYITALFMMLIAHYFFTTRGNWFALLMSALAVLLCIAVSALLFIVFHIFLDPSLAIAGLVIFIVISLLFDKSSQVLEMMRLKDMVTRDELTDCFNYRYFETCLKEIIKKIEDSERYSLIALDIDHFKDINDTRGHEHGNEVLQTFSKALKDQSRRGDLVFRFGGDEFIVLLKDSQRNSPSRYLDRVKKQLELIYAQNPTHYQFRFSAGAVTIKRGKFKAPKQAVEAADSYLYKAKNQGRNIFFIERDERPSPSDRTDQ